MGSRLKPQPKLPPLPFLANLIEKPSDRLWLVQSDVIEVLAYGEGEVFLRDSSLGSAVGG